MTAPLPDWPRQYFEPGGGDAHLFYKIHGAFSAAPPAISRARYRTAGVPDGCDLMLYTRASNPEALASGLLADEWIGDELRRTRGQLARDLAATDQCLVLHGVVADPPNLDYFRDAVGVVMGLLDSGGIAVFDPHMFTWWSAAEWRERAFEPAGAVPRHHVTILVSDDEAGGRWYHTRGMLKFGRPDLSIHAVPPELEAAVEDLCNRFIELQAFGGVVPEGQAITMSTLPSGWRCHHRGSLDDPDFNNRHIDIGPG